MATGFKGNPSTIEDTRPLLATPHQVFAVSYTHLIQRTNFFRPKILYPRLIMGSFHRELSFPKYVSGFS